jgi:hypothetical protein
MPKKAPTRSLGETMADCAETAVENAKENGITLDYSSESIKHVEKVLETFCAELPRTADGSYSRTSAEDIVTIARAYGGYIGEVLRRAAGGEWVIDKDPDVTDPNSAITLRKDNKRVFPVDKVMKRLFNGPEDNVAFYYQMVLKHWA